MLLGLEPSPSARELTAPRSDSGWIGHCQAPICDRGPHGLVKNVAKGGRKGGTRSVNFLSANLVEIVTDFNLPVR